MYILIISCVYPPEPVVSARLSVDLYRALKAEGKEVKVIHPKPTRPNGFNFEENSAYDNNVVTLDSYTCPQSSTFGRMRESVSYGRACAKFIAEHRHEINCIYANTWPLGSQYLIIKKAKKYGIPVAIHVQDVYPESLINKLRPVIARLAKTILLPLDKFILRNSNRVIAISDKMEKYLVETRGIDPHKCCAVINWQDETEFLEFQNHTKSEKRADKFTFMYMGNIGPVAGVDLLIDAFLETKIEKSRLVIAGSGSMKEMLIEKSKTSPDIEFWDVPNGKVPEIQSKADVMMLPIKKGAASSSIPSKLPAYMFSAKPIIGSMDQGSDTANAITEAGCGYIVEPENKVRLADMMTQIATQERDELEEMGKKGQKYALEHFSKMSNLQRLIKVIVEMV